MKKLLLPILFVSLIHFSQAQQCIDTSQIDNTVFCTPVYDPVCGCNNQTYANSCVAYYYSGITSYTSGACGTFSCSANFFNAPDSSNSSMINFYDMSLGTITDWLWEFGDGTASTDQNPVHTYNANGQYNVCLSIKDSSGTCTDSLCQVVYVGSLPTCNAYLSYITDSVNPNNILFTDISTGNPTTWAWDFGDGDTSTLQNPSHTYLVDGTYLVCLTMIDSVQNCTDTFCTYVYAGFQSGCQPYFSYFPDTANPFEMNFFDYSLGNPDSWQWTFGDGTSSALQNPVHTFATAGTFQVCLKISDSTGTCNDSICDNVMILDIATCQADFSYSVNGFINTMVSFTDSSTGNPSTWFWDFGDGNSATTQNPINFYADTGTYNVCLTISDSATACLSTYCMTVYLGTTPPTCSAAFNYTTVGNEVSFVDISSGTASNYIWQFGDGSNGTGANTMHTFTDSGLFNVCLTITNTNPVCFDTYCDSIYIAPSTGNCSASFTNTVYGDSVQFTDASTGSPISWYWEFDDIFNSTSTTQNPSFTYLSFTNTYNVCLTINDGNGCFDTHCEAVNIVGIKEQNSEAAVHIYPNPASGIFTVSLTAATNAVLTITNIRGEEVYSTIVKENNVKIDLNENAEGIYFLHITSNTQKTQRKLLLVK